MSAGRGGNRWIELNANYATCQRQARARHKSPKRLLRAVDLALGLDALERLEKDLPQVILADIEMPRMDGFELVRRIRADWRLGGIPVIMITSRTADKHRRVAADIGVQHYLGKPYDEERLLGLIAGLVRPA